MKHYHFLDNEGLLVKQYEEKQIKMFSEMLDKCAFSAPRKIAARAKYRRAIRQAVNDAKEKHNFSGKFSDVKYPDWRPFFQ